MNRNTKSKNTADQESGDDPESIVDDFLGGGTRANQLGEMRRVLAVRLQDTRAERDALPVGDPRHTALDRKVNELRDQVAALAQEEAINQFVEDSVRATLIKPRRPGTSDGFGDEFDDEY